MVCSKIIKKMKEVDISNFSERAQKLRKVISIPDSSDKGDNNKKIIK